MLVGDLDGISPWVPSKIGNASVLSCWASQIVLVVKNLTASAGDPRNVGLIPGLGRSSEGGNGNPLQCSYLENSMNRRAWRATVHGATELRGLD